MISEMGNKYIKKMYLRWKMMKVEEKQKYERAVANEVDSIVSQLVSRPWPRDGQLAANPLK